MSDPATPVVPAPAAEPAIFAAAHAELAKVEAELEAAEQAVVKFVGVGVEELKAVLAAAEFDVIGKAHTVWAAVKELIAKAEAAV